MDQERGARRRRQPEEAEREILDAACALFGQQPSGEVTVSAVMRRTTLSRKSFYVYFRDRHDLLTRLVNPIRVESDEMVALLRDGRRSDPSRAGEACLRAHAQLYLRHGPLLRALARSSEQDTEARAAWHTFVDPVVDALTELIEQETKEGRSQGLEPRETARALVGMNVEYFLEKIVDHGRTDIDELADVLLAIWIRTLYG